MEYIDLKANPFYAVLNCPCGMNNLHQSKYEIFDRGEDSERVTKTVIENKDVFITDVSNQLSGNPSSRRHGMKIHFWCEGGHDMVLNIYQHKGCTFMEWDKEWTEDDA